MLYAQPFADEFALNDGAETAASAGESGKGLWGSEMECGHGHAVAHPRTNGCRPRWGKSGRDAPEIAPHVFTFRSVRSFRRRKNNMKKKYDSPSVQKVSFRYRDQVVAASGGVKAETMPDAPAGENTATGSWNWREIAEGIFKWIWELFG